LLQFERQCWGGGIISVAGVDEAGRGPLAGPVMAGAVIFDRLFLESQEHGVLEGLTDSKKLSVARREHFYQVLSTSEFIKIGLGVADVAEIDEVNILNATHRAMVRAVQNLSIKPDHILVDGLPVRGFPCHSTSIIGGDGKSLSIAAASVVAKVLRDRQMKELAVKYPEYGFEKHKGYGSKAHMQALLEYGPSPVHRTSFRPVREAAGIRSRTVNEIQVQDERE
jgi:ribonuclease HII